MYPDDSPSSPASTASSLDDYVPSPDHLVEPDVDLGSPPRSRPLPKLAVQRSSHSRKRDPNYIPRPPNAFMIFRSDLWSQEKIKKTVERDHRQISRIAGELWNKMSEVERGPFKAKAEEAKRLHALTYPNYKYTPVYRKEKTAKRKKADNSDKIHRCQQVARLMQRGFTGDELKREMERREAAGDDYASDVSEYVQAPRRKKTRKSISHKRVASPAPRPPRDPKRPREPKVVAVKAESEDDHPLIHNTRTPPPDAIDDCCDEFVATEAIPELSIGEAAHTCGVRILFLCPPSRLTATSQMDYTDDFACGSSFTSDFASPMSQSCRLSDDFLGSSGDDVPATTTSPDDAIMGLFEFGPFPTPGTRAASRICCIR